MRGGVVLALVCLFTAFVAFKPSEPFLVAFMDCDKHISRHAIIHEVFPVWSWSYLAVLPFVCATAELAGHKFIVLLGAVCRLLTACLLLWPFTDGSVGMMQLSQVTIAVGFAAHPALSAIMYRSLPQSAYSQAAGLVASTGVVAEVVASLLGTATTCLEPTHAEADAPWRPTARTGRRRASKGRVASP